MSDPTDATVPYGVRVPAPRALPRYAEHNVMKLPPVVFLCPRCKAYPTYSRFPGYEECFKCSNSEPGVPYLSVDAVLDVIQRMAPPGWMHIDAFAEGLRVYAEERRRVQGSGPR